MFLRVLIYLALLSAMPSHADDEDIEVPAAFNTYMQRYDFDAWDGPEQYEITLTWPTPLVDVHFEGELPPNSTLDEAQLLSKNRTEAYKHLRRVEKFLLDQWKEYGIFVEGYGEGPTYEHQKLVDGMWPTAVVSTKRKPKRILYVIALALDVGDGLPWEWRTLGRGFRGNLPDAPPKKNIHVTTPDGKAWRRVLYAYGLAEDPSASLLASILPAVEGERAELKYYLKAKDFPDDLAIVVHRALLYGEMQRWSLTPIDDENRGKLEDMWQVLLRSGELDQALLWTSTADRHIRQMKDWLRNYLSNSDFMKHAMISDLYVEANSYMRKQQGLEPAGRKSGLNARRVLYLRRYGIKDVEHTFEDDDFGGGTDILKLSPFGLETVTGERLENTPTFRRVKGYGFHPKPQSSKRLWLPSRNETVIRRCPRLLTPFSLQRRWEAQLRN